MQLVLKSGKEDALLRFHPWVFSGAIKRIDGAPEEGDVVEVVSSDGQPLGVGHYQTGSIAVRMLSFAPCSIDEQYWKQQLRAALRLRKSMGLVDSADTTCYRWVHGEADGLPGLIVDVYGSTAVMQAHSVGIYRARNDIAKALKKVGGGRIKAVYDKSSGTAPPFEANLNVADSYLLGKRQHEPVLEHGLKFEVDWEAGQKTGFFLDQRENRSLLERYSAGRSVLNMFCYTGGFSVYALRGGAKEVVSVDSSVRAMEQAFRNVELNLGRTTLHTAITGDGFDYLRSIDQRHNLIVLDPPAFAKHIGALKNALQAYRRLNALALKQIQPGGIIFTFSCSQVVSREQFRSAVFAAAVDSHRPVKILHQLTQPADHPISIFHPEGEYLKGLVLQVN
ncbi:MAG: class I SAM-dependent rRNA methyltransferase [Prevotellaceae bacterium]|jgi:23S rRNA (cytosine1962-C5)-methyltransferase|nr:class I SAM-dependent rRNA methyltransferase [Prevotellaceae bacterium]